MQDFRLLRIIDREIVSLWGSLEQQDSTEWADDSVRRLGAILGQREKKGEVQEYQVVAVDHAVCARVRCHDEVWVWTLDCEGCGYAPFPSIVEC